LLDGELREEDARGVIAHLAECERCRRLRDDMKADRQAFVTVLHRAAQAARVAPIAATSGASGARRLLWALAWPWGRPASGRPRGRREAVYLAAGLTAGAVIGITLALVGGTLGLADIGMVTEAIGGVELHRSSGEAIPARPGDRLAVPRRVSAAGAQGVTRSPELTTGPSSTAEFVTADDCRLVLGPSSRLVFRDRATLTLTSGLVCAALAADKLKSEFVVETSVARFVARGTRYAVIAEPESPDIHWLIVSAGVVEVRSAQGAGRTAGWTGPVKVGPPAAEGTDAKPTPVVVRVSEWEGPTLAPAGRALPQRVAEARTRLEKLATASG
jgi:hypothetical protein